MSRSQRRRERAARIAPVPGSSIAAGRRPLPLLPLIATASGVALLATAWTTQWAPGEGAGTDTREHFVMEIPEGQQGVINSWERFFICYDLLDPAVVDATLRAAQRTSGTLDFPGARVEVVLPAPETEDEATPPAAANEDELIAARQAILGAAVPARVAQVRQQCAAGAQAR